MTTCIVRRLSPDDAETWASLRREALEAHPLAFSMSVPDEPAELAGSFRSRLEANRESAVFGAFLDEALVGIVGIARITGKKERHKSMIWGMYVNSGSRRGGAGEMLLRSAIEQARSWPGVDQVHLSVTSIGADARRLYERNGFVEWGREPRALCWEGEYVDEIHMVLDLRGKG